MDRTKFTRRLLLGGAVLGLGTAHAALFIGRNNRKGQLCRQLSRRGPLRLPSLAPSTPSSPDEDICSIAFSLFGSRLASGSAMAGYLYGIRRRSV